jgi:tetratricopeptide (TPR) repeat protein
LRTLRSPKSRCSLAEARGFKYFQQGNLDQSVLELDQAINLSPRNPYFYNKRAELFLTYIRRPDLFTEPGCTQQSASSYEVCVLLQSLESNISAAGQQPFNYRARMAAGHAAFNLQLNESAAEFYGDAVGMTPNSWQIQNNLAVSQIDLGLFDEAFATLEMSLRITGDDRRSRFAMLLLGNAWEALGELEMSIEYLESSLAMGFGVSTSFEVHARLVDIYSRVGRTRGLEQYDEAARRNPADVVAIFNQGKAHFADGNNTEALSKFLRVYTLGLRTGESVAYLSITSNHEGKWINSDAYIKEAINLEPENALIYQIRADILSHRLNFQSAIVDYDTAINLNPVLAPAYFGRGQAYAQLRVYDQAIEDFTQAISIDPDNPKFHGLRGDAYLNLGQDEKAIQDYAEATRLDPGNLRWNLRWLNQINLR